MNGKKYKIESASDQVIVDSADVERATEVALKRGKAAADDVVIDGKIVETEILSRQTKK